RPTYRHQKFPAYQSGRHFDEALLAQLDVLSQFVAACGFDCANAKGYEADGFPRSCSRQELRGEAVVLASGDCETFQLASEATIILFPFRAGEVARIGSAEVRAHYGVEPVQVPDFIALRSDPSESCRGPLASVRNARPTSCTGAAR